MKLIDTPYGRKTPALLCKALDAYERQRKVLELLKDIQHQADHGGSLEGEDPYAEITWALVRKVRKLIKEIEQS